MNKKTSVLIISVLFSVNLFCATKEEKQLAKAQSFYNSKGYEKYISYVSEKTYFAVRDENDNGATPLLLSIKKLNGIDFEFFIEKGASYSETDNNGLDLIDYCLATKNEQIINYIFEKLPSNYLFQTNNKGILNVTRIITEYQNYNFLKQFIAKLDNVNITSNTGKTLLMCAAQCNPDVRVIKQLIDQGADLLAENENNWTAIMYAARYNPNPYIFEDLLLRGSNTESNIYGISLLMLAACNPNPGVLLTALRYLSNINDTTLEGKTALMYACENQQVVEHINLLINNNANINSTDNEGKTALMYALENYTTPDIAYFLISAGADCSAADKNGNTVSEYLQNNVSLKKSKLNKILELSQNNGDNNITEDSLTIQIENNYETEEVSSEKINNNDFIETENKIDSVYSSVEIPDEENDESKDKN